MATADALSTYRQKRRFGETPEPAGKVSRRRRARRPRFVVQEHHATTVHWDLRLEHEGVLVSWAVPQGLPPAPGIRRLAVRTEDHPLDDLDVAGEIPAGSSGAGTMVLWDAGTYDVDEFDLDAGSVKVDLAGDRVIGRHHLVRTGDPAACSEQWLLVRDDPPDIDGWIPVPAHVAPMLATAGSVPTSESDWAFEVKWDGMRVVAFVDGGRIRLESRNQLDVTDRFPELQPLGAVLGSTSAVIDGEMVAFDDAGRPSFQALQPRIGRSASRIRRSVAVTAPVQYVAFDLLYLDGYDLTDVAYEQRRRLLRELLDDTPHWRVPDHHVGGGSDLLDGVRDLGLEGIVAKRLGSRYTAGARSGAWRKIKIDRRQEFVVGGWTEGRGRRAGGIGSLVLGAHDDHGRLLHVGNVGTGFSDSDLRTLQDELELLEVAVSPFVGAVRPGARRVRFVRPVLVGEVSFSAWTRAGTLRHPTWRGLRGDKPARDVVREDEARSGA